MLQPASQTLSSSIVELPNPFENQSGVIKLLEPANCDRKKLLDQLRSNNYAKPFIVDDGNSRSLYFSMAFVQSAMRVDDPYALEFVYTRKMMSFLFFLHQPRSILLLGLGGGSLAKYCYRHLPLADITVVEIDPDIVSFREQFLIPADDSRFRVHLGDAAEYVREHRKSSNVIMIDAFDRDGFSTSISSLSFYSNVRDALTSQGVMVANLMGEKAARINHLEMIRTVFDGNLIVLPVQDDGNYVVFAFRDAAFEPRWRWINNQAKEMHARYGLDFPKFAAKLERSRKLGYLQRIMHQPEYF